MRLYLTSGIFRFVVKSDIPGYNSAFFFFFFLGAAVAQVELVDW